MRKSSPIMSISTAIYYWIYIIAHFPRCLLTSDTQIVTGHLSLLLTN